MRNFEIQPACRIGFVIQKTYKNRQNKFFLSRNKLQCSYMNSFSVPNKKLQMSRFYLNKRGNTLSFCGYQK
jgi:hypothetical protein